MIDLFSFNFRERVNAFDNPEKAYADFVDRQKMKRLGSAEEVAGAVCFLASQDVSHTSIVFI